MAVLEAQLRSVLGAARAPVTLRVALQPRATHPADVLHPATPLAGAPETDPATRPRYGAPPTLGL